MASLVGVWLALHTGVAIFAPLEDRVRTSCDNDGRVIHVNSANSRLKNSPLVAEATL